MSFVSIAAQGICRGTVSFVNQHPELFNRFPALNSTSCTKFEDPQYIYSLINITTSTIAIVGGLIALYLNSTNNLRAPSLIAKTAVFCAAIAQLSIVLRDSSFMSKEQPCLQ